ncbi:hypothetical protein [Legionella drancourtii]|uniref:Uncharacterized protein n=1 Tax=Legionella drancourtii LLAP12 TaxID=658187 RepID=G9ELX1_9GAMM|nr:hypothetical protein [Legionella drancourtii]EHL31571.1 hypothetical protein LDG_6232 [Legionella drancourtii LLAP12]
MASNALVVANPEMLQELFNTPSILEEQSFLNLSSEVIVNLMDELNGDSLYWAVRNLLCRKHEEDRGWQIKCLKKLGCVDILSLTY